MISCGLICFAFESGFSFSVDLLPDQNQPSILIRTNKQTSNFLTYFGFTTCRLEIQHKIKLWHFVMSFVRVDDTQTLPATRSQFTSDPNALQTGDGVLIAGKLVSALCGCCLFSLQTNRPTDRSKTGCVAQPYVASQQKVLSLSGFGDRRQRMFKAFVRQRHRTKPFQRVWFS